MQMNYEFDASQFTPNQGGGIIHPVGRFPFIIGKTRIDGNKDQTGGMFIVTYKTPEGEIDDRFNLWHENPVTVRIAHEQLSALCHAVGIFKVSMQNEGIALLNAQGMIEVVKQGGDNPKGYTQVSKRLDRNGNEPGQQGGGNAGQQPGNNAGPGNGPGNGGGFQPPQNGNTQGPGGFQPGQGQQPQDNGNAPQTGGNGPSWGNNGGGNAAPQQQQPPAGQGGWQQGGGNNAGPSWGNR